MPRSRNAASEIPLPLPKINEIHMTEQISTNELTARLQKCENIRTRDGVVWKNKFNREQTISAARELPDGSAVKTAGRITALRWLGKLMFGRIFDINGEIQFSMSRDEIGEENYKFFKANLDMGDFVGLTGKIYKTTAGELTIAVSEYDILAKALRPLPEKFHGLSDIETRYRQRYLDVIANEESRNVAKMRIKMLRFIREFLYKHGFDEVETPILQNVAGGAAARPFITHHNALDADFYLRISPELYLKQMTAAGFDRVFEIAKDFRNEGIDPSHLQEFTMVEWYASYWDFNDNIELSKKFIQEMLVALTGSLIVEHQGEKLDFSKFETLHFTDRMNEIIGANILEFKTVDEAKNAIVARGLFTMGELNEYKSIPQVVDFVFKKTIRAKIIQPTIVVGYPSFLIALARRSDADNRVLDMFQLIAMGAELIKAYSELVDPIVQRAAFEDQAKNKNLGDDETFELDEGFLTALEHGVPPQSGLGFGVDRFLLFLTDQPNVRDVVFFPQMK
jgi:lysyl-tRNA synthetase class 2